MPSVDGLCMAVMNGKVGYIDPTGAWVVQPQFDNGSPFSQGLAAVRVREQMGSG